jgi:hypothetical protein
MFKKSFLTILISMMLTGSLMAVEYAEPILECDEKFDKCAEKCGDDAPDSCFDACEAESANCYKNYVYEDGTRPKVISE